MNNYTADTLKYLVGIGKGGHGIPESRKVVFRGVNGISLVIAIATLFLAPIYYASTGSLVVILVGAAVIGFFLSVILMNLKRNYDMANLTFYLALNCLTFVLGIISSNPGVQQWIYFALFALIFLLFQDDKTRLFAFLIIVSIAASFSATR